MSGLIATATQAKIMRDAAIAEGHSGHFWNRLYQAAILEIAFGA